MKMVLRDGIDEFRDHIDPRVVAQLLERTARWVDPDVFRLLPVWHPHTARKAPLFIADWSKRATNNGEPKYEGNVAANSTLTDCLGLRKKDRVNWTCCHIWGNDDYTYQASHSEVNDRRYFSCPANMLLLPTPLRTFTDTVPEVKSAIRFAAKLLYGFWPEGRREPVASDAGEFLPASWKSVDKICGVVQATDSIRSKARARLKKIKAGVEHATANFPLAETSQSILFWRDKIPFSLLDQVNLERASS